MERWSGILRVPLHPNSSAIHRVGVSLCLSPETRTLRVPIANAILFCGDRVEGTGNPVIERLSDLQNLSEIVVSKFGSFSNAWVIEASVFNGPFAVYKDFIPSVNQYGEPRSYHPIGFSASTSTVSLLSSCLEEVKKVMLGKRVDMKSGCTTSCCFSQPKTFILGFSKGGTVLNQIVTELGFSDIGSNENSTDVGQPMDRKFSGSEEIYVVPKTKEDLLNSIGEIHYVDVGLNSAGAYLTNHDVFERISRRIIQGARQLCFILHGTLRQWSDKQRDWIRNEKDKMLHLLESEALKTGRKLKVSAKYYFADKPPSMQMHFEIIESLDETGKTQILILDFPKYAVHLKGPEGEEVYLNGGATKEMKWPRYPSASLPCYFLPVPRFQSGSHALQWQGQYLSVLLLDWWMSNKSW